ncbi:MAG: formate dehydrogenase accessory sulfurtransferase FdhD [Planctomycetota bacterium]|nr:formate dehydrogenase accessory sulfurtransferase FdhD [Planctomycetota bacterium]
MNESVESWSLPSGDQTDIVVEQPLILKIGEEELVTMRSPGHDEELARGFLVSERIIPHLSSIQSMKAFDKDGVAGLAIRLKDGELARSGRLTRVHEIRASCGLCGVPSIESISKDLPILTPARPKLSLKDAAQYAGAMKPAQDCFQRTGGSHAAALFISGEMRILREDVGRHNAVDKVLGAALLEELDFKDAVLVLSGRSGFELIMKALRVGIPVIVSVSAPTSFAAELAEEAGATLIAFARGETGTIFSDDGRMILS